MRNKILHLRADNDDGDQATIAGNPEIDFIPDEMIVRAVMSVISDAKDTGRILSISCPRINSAPLLYYCADRPSTLELRFPIGRPIVNSLEFIFDFGVGNGQISTVLTVEFVKYPDRMGPHREYREHKS